MCSSCSRVCLSVTSLSPCDCHNPPRTCLLPAETSSCPSIQVQEVQTKRLVGSLLPRLRTYAEQILEAAYDVLMDNVRGALEPGLGISRLAKEDFLRFLQLTAFFTAYVRGKQVSF